MSDDHARYAIPKGQLGLTGPVEGPRPGTLPIRGDVAHIALADRYLVPHYVVPKVATVKSASTRLLASADPGAETLATLEAGARFEALDVTSQWVWGACGPEGPSGYVERAALDI